MFGWFKKKESKVKSTTKEVGKAHLTFKLKTGETFQAKTLYGYWFTVCGDSYVVEAEEVATIYIKNGFKNASFNLGGGRLISSDIVSEVTFTLEPHMAEEE